MDDRPWPEWKDGKPLSKAALGRQLTPLQILSGTIRFADGETLKGYYLEAFEDAFARYLPPENVTTSQAYSHGHCDAFQSVTPIAPVTLSKTSQPYGHSDCDGVTFSNPETTSLCAQCGALGDDRGPVTEHKIGRQSVPLHQACYRFYLRRTLPPHRIDVVDGARSRHRGAIE